VKQVVPAADLQYFESTPTRSPRVIIETFSRYRILGNDNRTPRVHDDESALKGIPCNRDVGHVDGHIVTPTKSMVDKRSKLRF
jgi:hypothetical protein